MTSPHTFTSAGSPPGAGYSAGATPSNLQKAKLSIYAPPPGGGTGKPGAHLYDIDFQFNPKELSLTKNAKWTRKPQRNAKKSAPPEFAGSDPSKLSIEMFLDATDTMGDQVVKTVEQLFSCCVPTEQSRSQGKGSPPWVVFKWGGMTGFTSFVSSVTAKYTLFTPAGTAVRATCTVNLEEVAGRGERAEPDVGCARCPRRARDRRRGHAAVTGVRDLRRPRPVALDRRGQRYRRPDAGAPRPTAPRSLDARAGTHR